MGIGMSEVGRLRMYGGPGIERGHNTGGNRLCLWAAPCGCTVCVFPSIPCEAPEPIQRMPPKKAKWQYKNKWWAHENYHQERRLGTKKHGCRLEERAEKKLICAATKDAKSLADAAISEQSAVFARTMDSRPRQISSRQSELD